MIKEAFRDLFHLVFPSVCMACQTFEPLKGIQFCLSCHRNLPYIALQEDAVAALIGKEAFPSSISDFHSLFYYTKEGFVADMIHRLKYQGQYRIGRHLGLLLGQHLDYSRHWTDYTVVPVPIHTKRYRKRGYNQAAVIGKSLASMINASFCEDYLIRSNFDTSQTTLDKSARETILHKSFKRNPHRASIGKILLVDDVVTTGSTVNACVKVLEEDFISDISVASIGISI